MNNKSQNVLISIISVIGVAIILLMFYIANLNKTLGEDDNSYQISFKVYYIDNELVIDETLTFNENETLLELMNRTHQITTKVDNGSPMVLSIDEYSTDAKSCYFSLYVDGVYSSFGAKGITLTGGLSVEWIYKEL